MQTIRRSLWIACVLLCSAIIAIGQGFSAGSLHPPAVNESDLFVSTDGRFSIALPPDYHGFTPVSANTAAGKITGDSYDWSMKEGRFTAGYIDRPEVLEEPAMAGKTLDFMRDNMIERSKPKAGKFVGEQSMSGLGHPGREIRIEFPDGLFIERIFLVNKRMYLLSVILHQDQLSKENIAVRCLDSFKILSPSDLEAALKKRIADATPSPLPQGPVPPSRGTDARDEGLQGRVKTVSTESEDLSGTWAVGSRKPDSIKSYNEAGNLTKSERYDWKGNLSDVEVFGYIDGDRVSQTGHIRHEYDPPPMALPAAPAQKQVEPDKRYGIKLKYSYDGKGRMVERSVIGNDGELRTRCLYVYESAKQTESCYANGNMYYRSTSVLDDRGNETEKTIERPSSKPAGDTGDKYSYTYEFDAQANWIKKTTSKWVTKDGRSYWERSYTNYRTITYY